MNEVAMTPDLMKTVLRFQRDEMNSAAIRSRASKMIPDAAKAGIAERIAAEKSQPYAALAVALSFVVGIIVKQFLCVTV